MSRFFGARVPRVVRHVHVNMPWVMLSKHLRVIQEERFHLELGFTGDDLDRLDWRALESSVALLRSLDCRLTLHGPFWELCPGSCDALIRQVTLLRWHQILDVAARVGPRHVVCHTGFDPRHHREQKGQWIRRALTVLEPLVDRAERLGVCLCLENVWEEDPSLHEDIFSRLDSPFFGFCLDVGHQHAFSQTPLTAWLEALSDRLLEIHVHDNDGSRDDHLPVGMGSIDFALLFGTLLRKGRKPLLTVEPHTKEHLLKTLVNLDRVLPHAWLDTV